MDIEIRQKGKRWIAEVWENLDEMENNSDTYSEEQYMAMNKWCYKTLGYHARTAYHMFEFRNRPHLDWFVLRWQ